MAYLLDTNHCSYIINGLHKAAAKRKPQEVKAIAAFEALTDPVYTCDVVVGEMYYGAEMGTNAAETYKRIDRFLKTVFPLVADKESWLLFAQTKAALTKSGKVMTDFDLLIACIAQRHNYIFVTNDNGFKNLPASFQVENWTS